MTTSSPKKSEQYDFSVWPSSAQHDVQPIRCVSNKSGKVDLDQTRKNGNQYDFSAFAAASLSLTSLFDTQRKDQLCTADAHDENSPDTLHDANLLELMRPKLTVPT
jgi:hypothetical protein